jgi:hypothetical protein
VRVVFTDISSSPRARIFLLVSLPANLSTDLASSSCGRTGCKTRCLAFILYQNVSLIVTNSTNKDRLVQMKDFELKSEICSTAQDVRLRMT